MSSDYAARFVRYGLLSREEAVEIVKKRDHNLDNRCVEDFCSFVGISKTKFWQIIEKHYNRELFYQNEFAILSLETSLNRRLC